MSVEMRGGIDYALLRRHYDADDYVAIPFTSEQTFYVVGLMAYLSDPNVVDPEKGWTTYTHGEPSAPTWLAPTLAALGIEWAATLPAFEAKDILFLADQDCYVRFEGSRRVQHLIPANTYMHYHRRCFKFYVVRVSTDGVLRCWLEG